MKVHPGKEDIRARNSRNEINCGLKAMIAVEIQDEHYNYYFFLILPLSRHPVESGEQDIGWYE